MNGLIIIGYQGIGKSSIANDHETLFIDFESSLFKIDGHRNDDWYILYCKQAVSMAKQGFVVLISSHECVRNELSTYSQKGFSIITITPAYTLKEQWLKKLYERYQTDHSEKNFAAYLNTKERYEENIREIASEPNFSHIFINSMNYDLKAILENLHDIYNNRSREYYSRNCERVRIKI